jgi:hypothetical protein
MCLQLKRERDRVGRERKTQHERDHDMDYDDYMDTDPGEPRMSAAEREQRTEDECEAADCAAHRLYRSPLADLILQRVADLTAELEAVAVQLPNLCTMVEDMEQAEIDIDEDCPLACFNRNLDDSFGDEARDIIPELDNVIAGLALIAETLKNARKAIS